MTRQDYIRAARIVRSLRAESSEETGIALENAFRLFFLGDNPRFDPDRFVTACKLPEK